MNISFSPIGNISRSLLKHFDCGIEPLNTYLKRFALKNNMLGLGKTFIALSDQNQTVGYVTLCSAQAKFEELPEEYTEKLPHYPIPAIRIARLAVDKSCQGQGIGKYLLKQTFLKILQAAEITGIYLIIVDAKESAVSFYEQFGFIKLPDYESTYFLPIETIRNSI